MRLVRHTAGFLFILFSSMTLLATAQPPALIPMPQSVKWNNQSFSLNACKQITINHTSLQNEAVRLQQLLSGAGKQLPIQQQKTTGSSIQLQLGKVPAPQLAAEAYRLTVSANGITITANTAQGIFYGIQTLAQLINNGSVPGCTMVDYPAYAWRGYMVDAGRNYQSPALLKQQIDIMSRYKLNRFHFHITEDIAWRLQVKQYPRLTTPENMQRNKGKYYSVEDLHDLIAYCKDRFITLVPEIDMPGHSAAFTRALGTNMQTEQGLQIVRNILTEICTTYDVPYIHIGADEVKISNNNFLPAVTALIQSHNKQVIGWAPGGNYNKQTIRQLWKDEGEKDISDTAVRYIDSRSLYLSDFDPLNAVVMIFQRQLGYKQVGDNYLWGAEICLWADRRVEKEEDLLIMNPVFPSILAFGERSWRGGGYAGIHFNIGPDTAARAKAFIEFEKRLLQHKDRFFAGLPFPYARQTQMTWKLFGPFQNNGQPGTAFWPEKEGVSLTDSTAALRARGGTIWLWHTNWPVTAGWLPAPAIKTTWYAYTSFQSVNDTMVNCWIDFKDFSRSGADATPAAGAWDEKQSQLWVNGQLIPPPVWTHAGRPGGRLEEPMIDEGYYYRPPTVIHVKKGLNQVLVKLPLVAFNHADWQVPPKWMFTFLPLNFTGY